MRRKKGKTESRRRGSSRKNQNQKSEKEEDEDNEEKERKDQRKETKETRIKKIRIDEKNKMPKDRKIFKMKRN